MAADSFTSPTPHFFKIILPHTLAGRNLEIPKKFVRDHGGSLLESHVRLNLPGGAQWDVELKKDVGKFWFEKGWPEFMEFYSIKMGHFLAFRYEGNCSFHVVVFDLSATEIQYPVKKEIPQFVPPGIEIEEDSEGGDGRRGAETARKRKRGRPAKRRPLTTGSGKRFKCMAVKAKEERVVMVMENARAFKAATVNPSFMVTMRPSYLKPGRRLTLPSRYFAAEEEDTVVSVTVSDGRIWKIGCSIRWGQNRKITEFNGGWSDFVRENELHEGDICVFQIIPPPPATATQHLLLEVAIFRVLDN